MSGVHYKAKIRQLHNKLISSKKKEEEAEPSEKLWEEIASKNVLRWSLAILGKSDKEGWMIKKGGIGGALTKRYFVLYGPLLFYYSTEAEDSRAKGVVPLKGADIITYTVPEKEAAKYEKKASKSGMALGACWAIITRHREFVISCDSEEERADWMSACSTNTTLEIRDADDGDPKTSRFFMKKLLDSPDQIKKDIDSRNAAQQPRKGLPSVNAPSTDSVVSRTSESHTHELSAENADPGDELDDVTGGDVAVEEGDYSGGTCGGWRYDDGVLKTIDLKTDGSWPFVVDEPGLYINCKYSWDGHMIIAQEGSGSCGEWDESTGVFTWSTLPLGQAHVVYKYQWKNPAFTPLMGELDQELPIWVLRNGKLVNSTSVNAPEFQDVDIEGSIPFPILLAVAMHTWQWKAEGELTLILQDAE